MAVNSPYKRISMLRFASAWVAGVLFVPQVSGLDGPDRAASLHLYGGNSPFNENLAPVATDDAANATTAQATVVNVIANDVVLPPAEFASSAVIITVQPPNGGAVANANNTVTYTSDAGYNGSDTFTYQVTDSEGNSDTAQVVMTVTGGVVVGAATEVDAVLVATDTVDLEPDRAVVLGKPDDVKIPRG